MNLSFPTKTTLLLTGLIVASVSFAQLKPAAPDTTPATESANNITDVNLDLLKHNVSPHAKITDIKPTPINGMYELQVEGQTAYISKDGKYIMTGDMIDLSNGKNLTAQAQAVKRKVLLAGIADKDMIIYPAKNEKYVVNVYTDITCPYCNKLHQEIPEYNKAGITVKYLAFPRAGENSSVARRMQLAWCAKDKQTALNQLKAEDAARQEASAKNPFPKSKFAELPKCEGNQVVQQYRLGVEMGVNATPTMILNDGQIIAGYRDAKELLQTIEADLK